MYQNSLSLPSPVQSSMTANICPRYSVNTIGKSIQTPLCLGGLESDLSTLSVAVIHGGPRGARLGVDAIEALRNE